MTRHFLQLYALIVLTLAAVSWAQDRLWQGYSSPDAAQNPSQIAVLQVVRAQLRGLAEERWPDFLSSLSRSSGVDLELLAPSDIVGEDTLARLASGEFAQMRAADGETWLMMQASERSIVAFRYRSGDSRRSALEWTLVFIFYAAIALVIMAWLWPLRRDLRALEHATSRFGDRAWSFDAPIGARSQVHSLAQAFRRMAQRIDGLIRSHQDMSNAMSHEIKTPLSRMRFEVEMARTSRDPEKLQQHLNAIDTDIAELNSFVTATLNYAILERAEVAINLAPHDFTLILPAITESVARSAPGSLHVACDVDAAASRVVCDAHLIETVLRNLLYNALRYARGRVVVSFVRDEGTNRLCVDDDGPGIPPLERARVFESFVQLEPSQHKTGFGLGLAIVKRIVDWHQGSVTAESSTLGGARFRVEWPAG
jgi:signal transduction histidine kinase